MLHLGDCLEILPTLEAGSVDAVITDPPFNAGKEFANDDLDALEFRAFTNRWVLECFRMRPTNVIVEVGKGDTIIREEAGRYFQFRYSLCLNYTNAMRNGAVGYANWGLALWFAGAGDRIRRSSFNPGIESGSRAETIHCFPVLYSWFLPAAPGWPGYFRRDAVCASGKGLFHA